MNKKFLMAIGTIVSLLFSAVIQFLGITGTDKGFPIRYVIYENETRLGLGVYYGHPGTELVQVFDVIFLAVLIFSVLTFFYWFFMTKPKLLFLSIIVGLIYHGVFLLLSLAAGFGEVSNFGKILYFIISFPIGYMVDFLATTISGRETGLGIATFFFNGIFQTWLIYWLLTKIKSKGREVERA